MLSLLSLVWACSDDAEVSVTDPELSSFSGPMQPEEPLFSLIGDNPNGTWTLELDGLEEAGGTVWSFSVAIRYP